MERWTSYQPIETVAELPPPQPISLEARERWCLDFKVNTDASKGEAHANDVAAFANDRGGTILVGASDENGILSYPGVGNHSRAKEITEWYNKDIKDGCSPITEIDAVPIQLNGHYIVAINVPPSVDLIAAKFAKEGWRFPVRVGSHTKHLRPEEIPMYSDAVFRRNLLLLRQVMREMPSKQVFLYLDHPEGGPQRWISVQITRRLQVAFIGIEESKRVFIVQEKAGVAVHIPIRDVVNIWMESGDGWAIQMRGDIEASPARYFPKPVR